MGRPTLFWLSSYPKSGNTWTRVFLANYLLNQPRPVGINELNRIGASDAGAEYYARLAGPGFETAQHALVLQLRPKLLSAIAGNGADLNFLKTHNLNEVINGVPMIPAGATRGAVYILRNPLDVAISYARHFGLDLDQAIARMADGQNSTAASELTVKQFLGSWSEHVESWVDRAPFPVLTQRYEDMLEKPEETFSALLDFIGIPVEPARLEKAIRFSSFDELKKQETKTGFKERSRVSERFFHTGTSGQWRESMTTAQRDRILSDHRAVAERFGYL